ncbi:MAG: restriction endonuclease subunit S [Candidatus Thiodiazotropha lotti]|nr:restriction endonuclease subunit S [Candidatus Thiodiazotropha lotti]MCW4182243.1 restriction endonuclease subunit S [Candidatus Thiodiazotropha weberae]
MSHQDWQEVVVKDVCESVIDCVNKTAPVVDYETPYRMIRTTNVKNGVIDTKTVRYVEKETFEKWTRRAVPRVGDVILTREAPLGDVGMLTKPGENIFLGQRLMQYRTDPAKLDNYFLLYALQDSYMQGQLKAAGSGSTVEHIRVGDAENLKIRIPDIDTQKQLSSILRAYDELIENNNRRIAILEEMAQSLYREWFVKFRFPGHENAKFIDSPLGKIPEGWGLMAASEAIQINPRTKLPKEGEKPFVPMSGLNESSMVISDIGAKSGNSGAKFINSDTLFSRITPCLQNGKIGYVQFLDEEKPIGFGSTEFVVLRATKHVCPEYVYLMSRTNEFRDNAIKSMTGATGRQRVSSACFDSYMLTIPPDKIMRQFESVVKVLFDAVFNISKRIHNMRKQRELLLPRIISGNIPMEAISDDHG